MVSVIILCFNESINIRQVLNNLKGWTDDVILLDSYSTDNTLEIASEYDFVRVEHRKFDNYANQRNFAIKEIKKKYDWMLFLDADEYLLENLKVEIIEVLQKETLDGYYLNRRFIFMDKWIKYGGYYPTYLLRLFKHKLASCEREINEHIVVNGKLGYLKNDFVDHNRKDFTFWLEKHNRYATLEAEQLVFSKPMNNNLFGSQPERKQWVRQKIWVRFMPPLVRPFVYFIYRYFFRLGILDGKWGFVYHFMQGLVFNLIIDIKYLEKKNIK